ncbi:MAG: hypothetical protein A6F71_02630 [Cycloclasticus sp. symbiont of Poecilosclerida sp. M]|nr:MAG: hypothetical protein A6F71_02630 [Cycloclasticus sp. symbiont of Poecilosclerida sp. M]
MDEINYITRAQQYVALSNTHDLDATMALFDINAVYHSAYVGKMVGKGAISRMMSDYFKLIPNVHWATSNYRLIQPNTVCFNFEMTGTNTKTGESVSRSDLEEIEFNEEGQICRLTVGSNLISSS